MPFIWIINKVENLHLRSIFFLSFFMFSIHIINAQHFNRIACGITMDFNNEPPTLEPFNNGYDWAENRICDKLGNEVVKAIYDSYSYSRDSILTVQNKIYESNYVTIMNSINCFILLPFHTDERKFHLFVIEYEYESSTPGYGTPYSPYIYYYEVRLIDTFNYDVQLIHKIKQDTFVTALAAAYTPDKKGYWLVAQDFDLNFTSFKIENDSLNAPIKSNIPNLYNKIENPGRDRHWYYIHILRFSNSAKYLANAMKICRSSENGGQSDYFFASYFFNFNPENGKVNFVDTISYTDLYHQKRNMNPLRMIESMAFSPNDDYLYLSSDSVSLLQINTNDLSINKLIIGDPNDRPNHYSMILANNGKIYLSVYKSRAVINEPDSFGEKCNIQFLNEIFGMFYPYTLYENIATKINYKQECENTENFDVICDTSKYKKFTWHYLNDSIVGKKVRIDFPASGEYIVSLEATTDYGYVRHHTDTFLYIKKPVASFVYETDTGCQWVGFKFIDNTDKFHYKNLTYDSWFWDFGDGVYDTVQNPVHVYTKAGAYKVTLIYSNGWCSDTFVRSQKVVILEAPKPGFEVNHQNFCSPFTVEVTDRSIGVVSIYLYSFGDSSTSKLQNPEHDYLNPEEFWLSQTLYGPTGCIAKDSIQISLVKGYSGAEKINSLTVNVNNNNSAWVYWNYEPTAYGYKIFQSSDNQGFKHYATETDTIYKDLAIDPTSEVYYYYVSGVDSCGRPTLASSTVSNILLKGESFENNYSVLTWTPFEKWQNGVEYYQLEFKNKNGGWEVLQSTKKRSLTDEGFFSDTSQAEKCYRITATEKAGNNQQSVSNEVCLKYVPLVWIPNSFTPNGDGLNEVFRAECIGIESFKLTIYNRWGQLIFQSSNPQNGWDGSFKGQECSEGSYIYIIEATGRYNKLLKYSGFINLIK